jgi:hypothetical protein
MKIMRKSTKIGGNFHPDNLFENNVFHHLKPLNAYFVRIVKESLLNSNAILQLVPEPVPLSVKAIFTIFLQ